MEQAAKDEIKLLNMIASPGFKKAGNQATEELKKVFLKNWLK
jgi:hypothetical protein